MNWKKYLYLDWEKVLILVALWIVFVVLHNLFYGLFGVEEALFFILAVIVLPLYFLIALVYTIVIYFRKNDKNLKFDF